ncbi:MAG: hypothetical protein AAGM22_00055 [Acidobacteriota bacterium]
MKKYLLALIALTVLVTVQTNSTAVAQNSSGYVMITHPETPHDSLSKNQASSLLLKKRSRWPDSDLKAAPVDLDGKSEVREFLSRDLHSRSVSSIKSYWQKQIFSGRNSPPPELSNDAEVIAWVSKNPGAIGYVSPRASLDGVKALSISE